VLHNNKKIKRLHFADPLPERILAGTKTATWRLNDEKGIGAGDILSFCRTDEKEFARARATAIKEIAFKEMTAEDKKGHESYYSDDEMYRTFSRYYATEVGPGTQVKIIAFELLKQY
jgi:hypothetical protein